MFLKGLLSGHQAAVPAPARPDNLDIDFTPAFGHNQLRIQVAAGEPYHMNTEDFDKQAHAHLSFYHNFMNASKIVVVLVILTLIVMAATLL